MARRLLPTGSMRRVHFALAALPTLTACLHRDSLDDDFAMGGADSTDEYVVVQDVEVAQDSREERAPIRVAAALPASNADHPRPDPVPFRIGAGHGALGNVDLGPCHDRGLPSGYLRLRVTFRPSGHVSRVAVESEDQPPPDALACVGEQLEAPKVPVFDGDDVRLSRIFFVN